MFHEEKSLPLIPSWNIPPSRNISHISSRVDAYQSGLWSQDSSLKATQYSSSPLPPTTLSRQVRKEEKKLGDGISAPSGSTGTAVRTKE